MEFELIKVVCVSTTTVRRDGRVVSEIIGQPVSCYDRDQLANLWEKLEAEVDQQNAEQNGVAPEIKVLEDA